MTFQAVAAVLLGLIVMLAVGVAYVSLAQRFRVLWHPLAIIAAVGIVGMFVAVLGALFNNGWAGVPAMLRRSAIGAFGWGVIIAVVVSIGRRVFRSWMETRT